MSSPNSTSARSLRTELLLTQGTILVLIVLGFAIATYTLMRHSIYREAESDLLGAAQMIAQELRSGTDLKDLAITRTYRHRFGPAPRDHAYFAIWNTHQEQIAGNDPLPPHVVPLNRTPSPDSPRPFAIRHHRQDLEVIVPGPNQLQISVGRPLAKEHDRMQSVALTLALVTLLALALGAAATWRTASRIANPLEKLATDAETVSAQKLDQRLEVNHSSREIMRLSKVLNAMLERLQIAFQQQVRFTADASHELRTPVTVILTQAEHSLARPRTSAEYESALQTCARAGRRMKRLVDDLLLLARSDAGRLESRREACDLAELVSVTATLLEPLAVQHQLQIQSDLQSAVIHCNAPQITQVLTNLLTNAIHYNRPGGNVIIVLTSANRIATLAISDTGIGISAEDQAHIFDRFFQADKSRTPHEGLGTGLGLSIVAEIVSAHRGKVEVTSTLGQGTTFTLTFPLSEGKI